MEISNQGAVSIKGFAYQHAYACRRIVEHFRNETLISITLEGDEDIDLVLSQNNGHNFTEHVQVKSRENGKNWTVKEFAREVLAPFFQKRIHRKDFSSFHFITNGNANPGMVALRDKILGRIIASDLLDEKARMVVADLCETILSEAGDDSLAAGDIISVLEKTKISTNYCDFATIRQLTYGDLSELGLKENTRKIHDKLFAEIVRVSGLKDKSLRRLTAATLGELLEMPFYQRQAVDSGLDQYKSPARYWYVHRSNDDKFRRYLASLSSEKSRNMLVTGESGIGKSSFLNYAESEAIKSDFTVIKLRADSIEEDSFMSQMCSVVALKFSEINISPLIDHPSTRLFQIFQAYRKASPKKPILVLIDQFERLFEAPKARMDEFEMKQIWRRFQETINNINGLSGIHFVLTARTQYFFKMFPGGWELDDSNFTYIQVEKFTPDEATTLLENLLDCSQKEMTPSAIAAFFENSGKEPQLIILAFVKLFRERTESSPVDTEELMKIAPWEDVFKDDIESVIRKDLPRLITFAMANIGREVCTIKEIMERIAILNKYTLQQVEQSLLEIQNANRLIIQNDQGDQLFYHRNVGDYILEHYRLEFPPEWVEEGVVWDVHNMIKEEVRSNKNKSFQTLIGPEKLAIIYRYADKLQLDREETFLLAKSSVNYKMNAEYWVHRAVVLDIAFLDQVLPFLKAADLMVRQIAVTLLFKFGENTFLDAIEGSITFELTVKNASSIKDKLIRFHPLLCTIMDAFECSGYLPASKKRLLLWIGLSMLFDHKVEYWFRHRPELMKEALAPILKDLEAGAPKIVHSRWFSPILWAIEKTGRQDLKDAMYNVWEPRFGSDYWEGKEEFMDSLPKALAPALSVIAKRVGYLAERLSFEQLKYYLNFFSKIKPQIQLIDIKRTVSQIISGMDISGAGKKEVLDILERTVNYLRYNSELQRPVRLKIGSVLSASLLDTDLAKALEISMDLDDYDGVCSVVAIIGRKFRRIKFENGGEALISIFSQLAGDSRFSDTVLLKMIARLVEKLLEIQDSSSFFIGAHWYFLEFYTQYLNKDEIHTIRTLPRIVAAISKNLDKGNSFLNFDLFGSMLLLQEKYRLHPEIDDITVVYDFLIYSDEAIAKALSVRHEELKGDVFFRMGKLATLIGGSSRALMERSVTAHRYALKHYDLQMEKDDEMYGRMIACAANAIVSAHQVDPPLEWKSVLENNPWQSHAIGLRLMEFGHWELTYDIIEMLFDGTIRVDDESKIEIASSWMEKALHRKDVKVISQCWKYARLDQDTNFVDMILQTGDQQVIDAILAFIESENNCKILLGLSRGLINDPVRLPQIAEQYFRQEAPKDEISYNALLWMTKALVFRDWAFVGLCRSHLNMKVLKASFPYDFASLYRKLMKYMAKLECDEGIRQKLVELNIR